MRLLLWLGLSALAATAAGLEGPAFRDVAAAVGLDFHHFNGMSGKLYFAEHVGGSAALFDYDNDGDLDVYLGQGNVLGEISPEEATFPPRHPQPLSDRLYRNDLAVGPDGARQLSFTDVTEESGLAAHGYSMGVAIGDYDADGWLDLYATNLGANQLWRNRGDGTFEDVTQRAGADDRRWSVPASFFDFDGDGWLDLYVGNYVGFRVATHKDCAAPTGQYDYCGPKAYPPEANRLLRNRGDGTFEDVTERSNLAGEPGATLGTVTDDFNGDGLVDLYVANDMMVNELWINQGDGTFRDEALLTGTATDGHGKPQASMGVVAGDLDGNGHVDLFITHLLREMSTLYLNDGQGNFTDATRGSGLGRSSWNFTGFGTALFDYDGDAVLDLFVANGAVRRVEAQLRAGDPHPLHQENQLFRGLGGGRFEEVPPEARQEQARSEVSRGLAVGDIDNDGDPDLLVANNAGPPRLLLNQRPRGDDWIGLRLVGPGGPRDLPGTPVALATANGSVVRQRVRTDGSYTGAHDPRLLFSLPPVARGSDETAESSARIHIGWPAAPAARYSHLPTGRYLTALRRPGGAADGGAASP